MMLERIHDLSRTTTPLTPQSVSIPTPGNDEILIRVTACGVCHTELDEIEGRTPPPRFPIIPGHQVVGRVDAAGPGADRFTAGQRGGGCLDQSCLRSLRLLPERPGEPLPGVCRHRTGCPRRVR